MAITVTSTVTNNQVNLSWGLGTCSTFSYYSLTVYEGVFPSSTIYSTINQTQDSYTLTSVPNGDYYAVVDAYDSGLNICDTGSSGTITVDYTPPSEELRITFDDIANADLLVGDASDVADWNTFFNLPTNGNPYTSVQLFGNVVILTGGSNVTLSNNSLSIIGLFSGNSNILEIYDEGIVSTIDIGTFYSCPSLTSVVFLTATLAKTSSFENCTSLTTANLPALITAEDYCFAECTSLSSLTLTSLVTALEYCFYVCESLVTVNLPQTTTIGYSCFDSCYDLTTINIPVCQDLGGSVGNDGVFSGIFDQTIVMTVPQALLVCNGGLPDGDIQALQSNNTVTIITPKTGVKYKIEGTSDIYGKITVNIIQNLYSGSTTIFEGAGRNWVNLSIGQGGNDISQAILPSSCSVQFYVNSDFIALELAQDPPFSYQMQVLDSSNDIIWQGILLPEEYQEDYTNTPYIVTLVGSDGLEELKTIEYPITIGGKASLWDHLTTALSLTGLSLPYFESVNIYDVAMDTASSDSPFLQAEVTYESFLNINETPNCYDVIVAILKPFYSRIYQYRGWRIENIYGKKSSYIERQFNSSGAYVSQETINPIVELDNDPSDFKAFLGKSGKLDFHPALNSTTVYFNTAQVINPDGPGGWSLNSDWTNDTTLTDWTNENGISISKLAFGYNGSETIVRIQGKQDSLTTGKHIKSGAYTINSADFQNFFFRFDYWMNYPTLIILGSKPILYLQVELTDSLSNEWYYKNGSWTLIKDDGWIRIDAVGRQIWKPFEININTLPNITGSADIRFYVYQLVKSGSADQVELRLTNWATNIQIDEAYEDLILQEKAGLNILSTYKGPSFQHFISDGEVVDLAGVMDVNGVLTSEWNRRGETDSLNIRRLFILQWLTMHQSQAAKISGNLYQKGEQVTPMSVIKDKDIISTRKYIMTQWEFSLSNGIGNIKYHEIFENEVTPFYLTDFVSSIPSSAYILPDYSIPIGVPGLSPGVIPSGGINVPNFSFPALNGDVRGEVSGAELTPSAIFGKPRLDTTGLTANDIIFNAVKDTPTQENMTNLRLVDTYPILDTNFVPYTGAKSNTNLGEYGLTSGYVKFDVTPTNTPTDQGTMYWDADDETVALIMNGAIQKIGEDSFYQVKNQTGSNIAKGVAVRFAGTVGNSGRLLIAPFLADGTYPSTYFMGVTMEAIPNGEDGKVMWFGRIRGINTNAYNEGDILYASTTVAGGFQTTVPQAPNNIVEVCAVVTKSTNVGTIFVRPTLGSNINRDEGVKITSPATGDLLQLQAGGLWENKSLATIGLITGSGDTNYVPKFTGTRSLGNSQIFDNGTSVGIGTDSPNSAAVDKALTVSGTSNSILEINYGSTRGGYFYTNSINTVLSSVQSVPLLFKTADIERMRITSSGILYLSPYSTSFATEDLYNIVIDSSPSFGSVKLMIGTDNTAGVSVISSMSKYTSWGGKSLSLQPMGGNVLVGTVNDNGSKLRVNGTGWFDGTLSIQASATASTPTHIPVFIADPASTTRTLMTRTPAQLLGDLGGDSRYLRKDVADSRNGLLTQNNNIILNGVQATSAGTANFVINSGRPNADSNHNIIRIRDSDLNELFLFKNRAIFNINFTVGGKGTIQDRGNTVITINREGTIEHFRSSTSSESVRRDELYLNYSQTVATAGTINDLAINASTKLLILTACDGLTGVVPVDNTRLLRIEARGGNRIIRDQNADSLAANRFALGADLTINDGEVYQFIYTNTRWRRVL